MQEPQSTSNTGDSLSTQQTATNAEASPHTQQIVPTAHPQQLGVDLNQNNLATGNVKRINIAEKIKHDELMIRVFKWLAYAACMTLGVAFLLVGLLETKSLLDTQINTAKNQAALIDQQVKYYQTINDYNDLVKNNNIDASLETPMPKEKKDSPEKPLADKIISASAVLTMLAFILGVGLTLLLTLLKFSFNKDDNTAEITSPYGKLIIEIGEALRDKFKK
ncbi:hypothetical protein NQ808_05915 [Acinetobacter baumannii]|nr:hypothetical protein [Acinetobacter baumannii]